MPIQDLNSQLLQLGLRSRGISGSKLSLPSDVANTTASPDATAVTVPANALGVWVSEAAGLSFSVYFKAFGAGLPTKNSASKIIFAAAANAQFFPLDPDDLPSMFVEEEGTNINVAILFLTR